MRAVCVAQKTGHTTEESRGHRTLTHTSSGARTGTLTETVLPNHDVSTCSSMGEQDEIVPGNHACTLTSTGQRRIMSKLPRKRMQADKQARRCTPSKQGTTQGKYHLRVGDPHGVSGLERVRGASGHHNCSSPSAQETDDHYDKVLVMDRGRVAEYDEPHVLLQRASLFSDLVDSTGSEASMFLREAARAAYDSRRQRREALLHVVL
jgi:hypothetical protein